MPWLEVTKPFLVNVHSCINKGVKDQILSENDIKDLLLEHYTFLKRPVLLYDNKLFIGNTAKVITEAKAFLNEQ